MSWKEVRAFIVEETKGWVVVVEVNMAIANEVISSSYKIVPFAE